MDQSDEIKLPDSVELPEDVEFPPPPGPDNPGSYVMTMAEWLEAFEESEKREPTPVEMIMCLAHVMDMHEYEDAKAQVEQAVRIQEKMRAMGVAADVGGDNGKPG